MLKDDLNNREFTGKVLTSGSRRNKRDGQRENSKKQNRKRNKERGELK